MKTVTALLFLLVLSNRAFAQSADPSKWMCRNLSDSGGFLYQGESVFGTQACRPIPQALAQQAASPTTVASVQAQPASAPAQEPVRNAPLQQSQQTPAQEAEAVPPAEAQQTLRSFIPSGKKFVTVNAYVAGTAVKDVDLGVSCSSSSSANTTGSVADNGNIKAQTQSAGSSSCRDRHVYYYRMNLGFPDAADSNAAYLVTAECVARWVWDHCQMPTQGSNYPVVLEAGKHGTFQVYAATSAKLGDKMKVAKFPVLDVEHVKLNTTTASAN
jgi:hypothetical protein